MNSMENILFNLRQGNIMIAIIVALLVILFATLTSLIFNFSLVTNLVMSWVLTTFYAIFAFFTLDTNLIQKPVQPTIRIVERPVYIDRQVIKEVPVQIPVENRVIEIVEKPVETIRTIYIKEPKCPVIPKFDFIASNETKTFHKTSCRLSKLIKRSHKVHSNSQASLKNKGFHACKICIRKLRKI